MTSHYTLGVQGRISWINNTQNRKTSNWKSARGIWLFLSTKTRSASTTNQPQCSSLVWLTNGGCLRFDLCCLRIVFCRIPAVSVAIIHAITGGGFLVIREWISRIFPRFTQKILALGVVPFCLKWGIYSSQSSIYHLHPVRVEINVPKYAESAPL